MGSLHEMNCAPCRVGAPTVTDAERARYAGEVPQWEIVEVDGIPVLKRSFRFRDFKSALIFTNRVGEIAEREGHHPSILTAWGRVTVSWWTHKIKGLHRNDFIMAARTDRLYSSES